MKKIIILLICVCLSISTQAYTICIDAGHGGKDPGALGFFSKEKNISLSVALELGRLIEQNCQGTKVVYTRTAAGKKGTNAIGTETYTLGMHRAAENLEVAKRENTVITLESNFEQKYEGFDPKSSESYIIFELMQDQNMASSVGFAKEIQKQFRTTAKRTDRGVHQAGLLVLARTCMPAVLVELGYINNRTEEQYMNSKAGIAALAKSLYNAFVAYKK